MVAKITIPKSIEAALNYNEKKVQKGQAECLFAGNYLNDSKSMNFYQKLAGFENLNVRNDRATTKTLHVSLNFDPTEKLSKERLSEIASLYMEKIGFGDQPYLVYKHIDAGHPHLHIVSTTIQTDGSRINTHNIGRNQSEKARKEIEHDYNLVKAESQSQIARQQIKPVDVAKVMYGRSETKRSIANVVNEVVSNYKFTSLPELNAALKQFNVIADKGREEGRIFKHRGLLYRILDNDGNKIGVPIKASSISTKPTLTSLENRFEANELEREHFKQRTREAIDDTLRSTPIDFNHLKIALEKKKVFTLLRQNDEGRIYGITFVDNNTKCVFNGSDLGKQYSAGALQSQIDITENPLLKNADEKKTEIDSKSGRSIQRNVSIKEHKHSSKDKASHSNKMLEQLLTPKEQQFSVPFELLKKKKNKKNNNLRL